MKVVHAFFKIKAQIKSNVDETIKHHYRKPLSLPLKSIFVQAYIMPQAVENPSTASFN